MSEATTTAPTPAPTEPKPDQYGVKVKRFIDRWGAAKDGKGQLRGTIQSEGFFGPFTRSETAQQLALQLSQDPNVASAEILTIVDGPVGEQQVPASEDIVKEMVRQGKIPGVPADAKVTVEDDQPDNTVAFPGTEAEK